MYMHRMQLLDEAIYLGAYGEEEFAARAYDLAEIKYWRTSTFTNFPVSEYEKELEIMQNITKEYLATLRRRSSGFSRGVSKYRGVATHHHNGRWEARMGRVFGNSLNAVTNFDMSTYIRWLRSGYIAPRGSIPHPIA
ncbi:putative transcription factor AP2-EREBP family [Helianthus anomalus]